MFKKALYIIIVLIALLTATVLLFNLWIVRQNSKPFKPTKEEETRIKLYRQPEQWFIRNLKKPRMKSGSQVLDPKLQYMIEQAGDPDKAFRVMKAIFSIPLGRKYIRYKVDREWTMFTKTTAPMRKTINLEINGRAGNKIPVRIYVPRAKANTPIKKPVLIYAHGGGYLFGSIKAMDRAVQLMANTAQVMVVSVNYRLAPEHPYPAQSNDGEDVFLWAKKHMANYNGDTSRIAFGGDSGGALTAINVAQRQLAEGKAPPVMLLLYYPATGLPFNDTSNKLFGKGFGLDSQFFEYILTQVFPDQKLETAKPDAFMAPVQSKDLSGFPPTILATAGFDILRDSGHKFAKQLKKDGVPVLYKNYPGLTHSFLQYSGISAGAETAAIETARLLGTEIRKEQ